MHACIYLEVQSQKTTKLKEISDTMLCGLVSYLQVLQFQCAVPFSFITDALKLTIKNNMQFAYLTLYS